MAGDYGGMPTRYGAMLGTPERAAKALHGLCASGVLICERGARSGGGACPLKALCDRTGRLEPTVGEIADWLRGGLGGEKVRGSLGH